MGWFFGVGVLVFGLVGGVCGGTFTKDVSFGLPPAVPWADWRLEAYSTRGEAKAALSLVEQVLVQAQGARKDEPRFQMRTAMLLLQHSRALAALGRFRPAEREARSAVDILTTLPEACGGGNQSDWGHSEQCIVWETELAHSLHASAWTQLGGLLALGGERENASQALQTACAWNPNSSLVPLLQARLLWEQGRVGEALEGWRRVLWTMKEGGGEAGGERGLAVGNIAPNSSYTNILPIERGGEVGEAGVLSRLSFELQACERNGPCLWEEKFMRSGNASLEHVSLYLGNALRSLGHVDAADALGLGIKELVGEEWGNGRWKWAMFSEYSHGLQDFIAQVVIDPWAALVGYRIPPSVVSKAWEEAKPKRWKEERGLVEDMERGREGKRKKRVRRERRKRGRKVGEVEKEVILASQSSPSSPSASASSSSSASVVRVCEGVRGLSHAAGYSLWSLLGVAGCEAREGRVEQALAMLSSVRRKLRGIQGLEEERGGLEGGGWAVVGVEGGLLGMEVELMESRVMFARGSLDTAIARAKHVVEIGKEEVGRGSLMAGRALLLQAKATYAKERNWRENEEWGGVGRSWCGELSGTECRAKSAREASKIALPLVSSALRSLRTASRAGGGGGVKSDLVMLEAKKFHAQLTFEAFGSSGMSVREWSMLELARRQTASLPPSSPLSTFVHFVANVVESKKVQGKFQEALQYAEAALQLVVQRARTQAAQEPQAPTDTPSSTRSSLAFLTNPSSPASILKKAKTTALSSTPPSHLPLLPLWGGQRKPKCPQERSIAISSPLHPGHPLSNDANQLYFLVQETMNSLQLQTASESK